MIELFLEDDEIRLILSFLPDTKHPVQKGMDPTFYHTLDYENEVKLFSRIDDLRAKLGF